MKKIRVKFYVTPKFKWKYKVNWLISLWTRSKYSHVGIWTPDGDGNFAYPPQNPRSDTAYPNHPKGCYGTCYTSTMRGEANGTVKRPASEVLDKPDHWEYIELEITDEQYKILIWRLERKVAANKGYSKRDILKFLSPIHFPDEARDICSELVNDELVVIMVLMGFGIVSPKKVFKKLMKLGHKPRSLK